MSVQAFTFYSTNQILTRPSAPIRPLPVIRKTISTSHQSKLVGVLVQMAPFWLLREGAIRTFSELAIASEIKIEISLGFFQSISSNKIN